MGRFANSWRLFKASLSVVRKDKELVFLSFLSMLSTIAVFGIIVGVLIPTWPLLEGTSEQTMQYVFGALGIVVTYVLTFIAVYFQAAVMAGAHERLEGGDPTLGSALGAANKRFGALLGWAFVATVVALILRLIRERVPMGGIISWLGGMAWGLATYFAIPFLVIHKRSIKDSIKESAGCFKKTWGEQVIQTFGFGLIGFLFALPLILIGLGLVAAGVALWGPLGALLGAGFIVLSLVLLALFMSTLGTVYRAALFRYATKGEAGDAFPADTMQTAFAPRR